MSVSYCCNHLEDPPRAPASSSFASSSSSFYPLNSLYFCEECDAIRCNGCVAVEIASYYCPNCLFDVPSANVRGDKNRCARSCYSCPSCSSALQVQATDTPGPETGQMAPGPPYILACTFCKWNSKQVGWEFEKGTGIALQQQKAVSDDAGRNEFAAIKDHLDGYISLETPEQPKSATKVPTRHISHLTQMAAKALQRDVPGMATRKSRLSRGSTVESLQKEHVKWDEISTYKAKSAWRDGQDDRLKPVMMDDMSDIDMAKLDNRWNQSWEPCSIAKATLPERIQLQTKLTKRCPHPSCRHLLIQPDTKSIRFKIKMVAVNYLPTMEIGRRRRKTSGEDMDIPTSQEEIEKRRRERRRTRGRGEEEDEKMQEPLRPGAIYTYQLAFTNPLYDTIQIRLTQPRPPHNAPPLNHHIHIPTQHFTINALKDAWAYDEEEEDEEIPGMEGSSEVPSEEGTGSLSTLGRRNRMSLLAGNTALRDKKSKSDSGVEKKGNMTKVPLEVEVLPGAKGEVTFDLEVRFTYRVEEAAEKSEAEKRGFQASKDELKTFTFWVRVNVGNI